MFVVTNYNIQMMEKEKFRHFQAKMVDFFQGILTGYSRNYLEQAIQAYNYDKLARDYNILSEQDIAKFLLLEIKTNMQSVYSPYISDILNAEDISKSLDNAVDDIFSR